MEPSSRDDEWTEGGDPGALVKVAFADDPLQAQMIQLRVV
jgi:hypothetical protein